MVVLSVIAPIVQPQTARVVYLRITFLTSTIHAISFQIILMNNNPQQTELAPSGMFLRNLSKERFENLANSQTRNRPSRSGGRNTSSDRNTIRAVRRARLCDDEGYSVSGRPSCCRYVIAPPSGIDWWPLWRSVRSRTGGQPTRVSDRRAAGNAGVTPGCRRGDNGVTTGSRSVAFM